MAEQSSAVAMFRALIMMVCLIAIPLAALFGSSLPDAIKALKEGRWPTLVAAAPEPAAATSPATAEEPPKFEPPAAPLAGNAATTVPPPPGTTEPARMPLPAELPAGAPSGPPDAMPPGPSGVVPTHYETAVAPLDQNLRPPPQMPPASPQPAEIDPGTKIQNRLRQLGATYYLLEFLGGQQQRYRFYCKMAVGGNPNFPQVFEANDTDPLRAMSQVLQQVESWRAGR